MPVLSVIRPEPARTADLPAIIALQATSWRHSYAGILPSHLLGRPLEDWLARKWTVESGETDLVLVTRHEAAITGFVAACTGHPDGMFVDNLHVRPELKGRGIGTALMAAAARAAGQGPLWLEVLEANPSARALYKGWGGEESGVFEERLLGAPVPALRVRWPDAAALARRMGGGEDGEGR